MSKNPIEIKLINTIKNYDGSDEAQSNFFDILNDLEEISSDVIEAAFEKGNEQLINLILETGIEKEAVKLDKKFNKK